MWNNGEPAVFVCRMEECEAILLGHASLHDHMALVHKENDIIVLSEVVQETDEDIDVVGYSEEEEDSIKENDTLDTIILSSDDDDGQAGAAFSKEGEQNSGQTYETHNEEDNVEEKDPLHMDPVSGDSEVVNCRYHERYYHYVHYTYVHYVLHYVQHMQFVFVVVYPAASQAGAAAARQDPLFLLPQRQQREGHLQGPAPALRQQQR